jgi:hypothetical protein
MRKLVLLFFILIVDAGCTSVQTDSVLITELIKDIEASQTKQDGEFYTSTYPAYSKCAGFSNNYQADQTEK